MDGEPMMTGWAWVHILAAATGLMVGVLGATRGRASRLGLPLTLLAADQVAWNAASVGSALTPDGRWANLGAVASPLFTPLALHFVLRFLGKKHALRKVLWGTYAAFGAQSVLAAVDLVTPWSVPGGVQTFSALLLLTSVPVAALAFVLVTRHFTHAATSIERLRSAVLLVALAVVSVMLMSELLADLGWPVPRLATLGSFTFNVMLTMLTLGLGLFPQGQRLAAVAQAFVLALFAAVAYLTIFTMFSGRMALLLTASTVLSLVLAASAWFLFDGASRARANLERIATLGRFSAQMAHDLKNPLAAAKGAGEYLAEALRREGRTEHEEFSRLLVQQLDRLGSVIDRYQRLSKLEPEFSRIELNDLVKRVASLQAFVSNKVTVVYALHETALFVRADADLLASALENLIKNGFEAMGSEGTLTLTTSVRAEADGHEAVIAVSDTGPGMDARTREQVFEVFFTTKASGSGLGLAFVQQVARAHAGDVLITSHEGSGTVVELILPLETT